MLRLHGQVGGALQALGVGEAPLETLAQPPAYAGTPRRPGRQRGRRGRPRARRATPPAASAKLLGTVDVLFAVFEIYGKSFDRALYVRGATREELIERLAVEAEINGHTGRAAICS